MSAHPARTILRRPRRALLAGLGLAGAVLLAGCGSATTGPGAGDSAASTAASTASSSAAEPAAVPGGGSYVGVEEYEADPSAYAGTTVVYFFHAPWCPSCRATEQAIDETGVPEGLTLVKVDFDSATQLRQKYGVTTQHTFVQVGPDGAGLKTWTGSSDGAAILAETV